MEKCIIIDDEPNARKLLESIIKQYCPELEIVALCEDLPNGIKAIKKYGPSLIFLDIEMPGHSGLELLDFFNVKKSYPEVYDKYIKLSRLEPNNPTLSTIRPRNMFSEDLEIFKQFLRRDFDSSSPFIKIIDYKYMGIWDYEIYSPDYIDKNGENKVKDDIQKQLIYEWTVQQNWKTKTKSEFWIPYFCNDPLEVENIHPVKVNNTYFNKSQIELVKINFKTLQDFYIKQGLL